MHNWELAVHHGTSQLYYMEKREMETEMEMKNGNGNFCTVVSNHWTRLLDGTTGLSQTTFFSAVQKLNMLILLLAPQSGQAFFLESVEVKVMWTFNTLQ